MTYERLCRMKQGPKILIVDDEAVTRKGIIKNVPWASLGIKEIREAENGQQALMLIDAYEPDILMTDIRMPIMNGIELASQVKSRLPGCKIIFISGFSDKDYLKAAIHLGVVNYVEKPVDLAELTETIRKAIGQYLDDLQKPIGMVDESTVKKSLVEKLIRRGADISSYQPLIDGLGLRFDLTKKFLVLVVQCPKNYTDLQLSEAFEEINMDVISVFGISQVLGAVKDLNHLIWVVGKMTTQDMNMFERVKKLTGKRSSSINQSLFYSVSSDVSGLDKVYKAYQEAVINLQHLFFKGYGHWQYGGSLMPTQGDGFSEDDIVNGFEELLSVKKYDKISPYIKRWISSIRFNNDFMVNSIKNTVFQIYLTLLRHAQDQMAYSSGPDPDEPYLWEQIFQIETLVDLSNFINGKTDFVIDKLEIANLYSKSTRTVIRLIHDQYMNPDLSTKVLADQVYLTNSYLSGLFKKETGTNISQFIRSYRIEMAKEMLRETRLQLWEVAERVGYPDSNYFAKIFRKVVGSSPSDFRERQM